MLEAVRRWVNRDERPRSVLERVVTTDSSHVARFYAEAFADPSLEEALLVFLGRTISTRDLLAMGFAMHRSSRERLTLTCLPFCDLERLYLNRHGMEDVPRVVNTAHDELLHRIPESQYTSDLLYVNTRGDSWDKALKGLIEENSAYLSGAKHLLIVLGRTS